jgi:hypothetical protein
MSIAELDPKPPPEGAASKVAKPHRNLRKPSNREDHEAVLLFEKDTNEDKAAALSVYAPPILIFLLYLTLPSDEVKAIVEEMEDVFAHSQKRLGKFLAWVAFLPAVIRRIRKCKSTSGWKKWLRRGVISFILGCSALPLK